MELVTELAALRQLRTRTGRFELDNLATDLPAKLYSRALAGFLSNVRAEILNAQTCLDRCLNLLLTASDQYWSAHDNSNQLARGDSEFSPSGQDPGSRDPTSADSLQGCASKTKSKVSPPTRPEVHSGSHPKANSFRKAGSYTETFRSIREDRAQDMRAEFRRRRMSSAQSAARDTTARSSMNLKTTMDIDALRFMGFEEFPTVSNLRLRYRQLAKQYHPDHNPQHEDRFKRLTKAYNHLSSKVSSNSSAAI